MGRGVGTVPCALGSPSPKHGALGAGPGLGRGVPASSTPEGSGPCPVVGDAGAEPWPWVGFVFCPFFAEPGAVQRLREGCGPPPGAGTKPGGRGCGAGVRVHSCAGTPGACMAVRVHQCVCTGECARGGSAPRWALGWGRGARIGARAPRGARTGGAPVPAVALPVQRGWGAGKGSIPPPPARLQGLPRRARRAERVPCTGQGRPRAAARGGRGAGARRRAPGSAPAPLGAAGPLCPGLQTCPPPLSPSGLGDKAETGPVGALFLPGGGGRARF